MLSPWTTGDTFKLLISGEDYFPAVYTAISQAQSLIQIEVYILADDATGRRFTDELIQARKRGIKVQMILDGLGSKDFPAARLHELKSAGIDIQIFRPFAWNALFAFFFRRLHRKTIVIDRQCAFVGGLNIASDYYQAHPISGKSDIALQVTGPQAKIISSQMDIFWLQLKRRWQKIFGIRKHLFHQSLASRLIPKDKSRVRYRIRDAWFSPRGIERAYRDAIKNARHDILIANAYFFPPYRLLRQLARAVRRGVRVRLLLQGKADVSILKLAERVLYEGLIKRGIEIYEFQPRYFHAKVAWADGRWMTVGSSNLDPWSLRTNLEGNLIVENSPICKELGLALDEMISNHSHPVRYETIKALSLREKLGGWIAYVLVSFGNFLVGNS